MHSKQLIIADFLIIGGGIIGLSIARCLKASFSDAKIIVIEKENRCGLHASGRNSGVLHAGFYYTPDSLKARFTRIGNQLLTSYCEEKKLSIRKCGKLVVAKNANDLIILDELIRRGRENKVFLDEISADDAIKIEPRAKTYQRAIFSPTTSSINPMELMDFIKKDAENEGIEIHLGVKFLKRKKNAILLTTAGAYEGKYIINAAGLYADKIARNFNFSKNYRILPFKGVYVSSQTALPLNTHIYPVPNLKNPFLGVHVTITVDGRVKIGPTAIPAFWREQYHCFERFKLIEFTDILLRQMNLLVCSKFDFKKLAFEEIKKYSKSYLAHLAGELVTNVGKNHFNVKAQSGIRAQLLNIREKRLEMDFILEGDASSMHILNAVSPAFTSSLPFAQYVCDKVIQLTK